MIRAARHSRCRTYDRNANVLTTLDSCFIGAYLTVGHSLHMADIKITVYFPERCNS